MEHLALEVFNLATTENPNHTGSQYAVLEPDATITITDTSEIFADGDVWSYDFTLNVHANAHLFGTAGDIHGSRLHEQINKRKARLWVEGVPLYLGYLKLGDEAEVDAEGNVDVNFESGQNTFDELIEGAKANQVPMMDDVLIGMALWRKRWISVGLKLKAASVFSGDVVQNGISSDVKTSDGKEIVVFEVDGDNESTPTQQYPRMVFPIGNFNDNNSGEAFPINCLNTDYPYTEDANGNPLYPYCNVALCYQKQGYDRTYEDGTVKPDYSTEPEAQRGYEYMPANRVNSAPNFYVIYWLRCLMKHLGIYVEENQMMGVEDLRRLFFVNTRCEYKEPKMMRWAYDQRYGSYRQAGAGRLIPEQFVPSGVNDGQRFYKGPSMMIKSEECKFEAKNISYGQPRYDSRYISPEQIPEIKNVTITAESAAVWGETVKSNYERLNSYYHRAYATSDCFPNVDISEVINAIESGFGVRMLFSNDYKRVRIVLLRNVFSSKEVQDVACEIVDDDVKVENNIRGFRMTYGNTEDTHFYYKGFADLLPHIKTLWPDTSDKHDYSYWNLDASYASIIRKASAFNKTCYVTANTGNAFGVKIDEDAKRYRDLHPSIFEFAGFMDAEDGDCTGEEETIKTINVNFAPAIMNDLNMEQERSGNHSQRFALFVDETMRPRRTDLGDGTNYNDADAVYDVAAMYEKFGAESTSKQTHEDGVVAPGEFAIVSDAPVSAKNLQTTLSWYVPTHISGVYYDLRVEWDVKLDIEGSISEGYRLYLQDNYTPNDTGISPIETHDWGVTLGIMRGSGSDAHVEYSHDPDDGESNDTWDIVPGSSVSAHPDTCDSYGREWNYIDTRRAGRGEAASMFAELFPDSNATFAEVESNGVDLFTIEDNNGTQHKALFVTPFPPNNSWHYQRFRQYIKYLSHHSVADIKTLDAAGYMDYQNTFVEMDSSQERCDTLRQLIRLSLGYDSDIIIDHGVSSRYGRFSLKLRAEKPNPYYVAGSTEEGEKNRYLEITSQNLQQRGLTDQFYKEYSYWIRNARIVKRTVRMTLAQLLTIDKTVRVTVGDVTGFIRKIQYTVSNETGLGNVVMEIMYI